MGRGEAFVATADNASAIYYNPAGITQLHGLNLRAGAYGIYIRPTYDSPAGSSFANEKTLQAAPQFFATYGFQDSKLSLGLGIYAPYGLSLRWPQDTGFRTLGIESSLTYLSINPVLAWRITPTFSVGAGLTINYADAELKSGLAWPTQASDEFKFRGSGWDVGYNLGALWKVSEQVSLGASFRSSTTITLDGHTTYRNDAAIGGIPAFSEQRVDAQADVHFPWNAVAGISYRPTPKWNLEFDADYTDWSSMDTVTIHQGSGPLLPRDIPSELNWKPAWYYKAGATRYLDDGWSISAGYIYAQNAIPDSHYTPLVADSDKHFVNIGIGHRGPRWEFDIAYQIGFSAGSRSVSGSQPSPSGQTVDGRYTYLSHAVLVTVGYHF